MEATTTVAFENNRTPNEGYSYINHIIMTSIFLSTARDGVKRFIYGDKNSTVSTVFQTIHHFEGIDTHIQSIPINSFPIEKVSTEKCKLCLTFFDQNINRFRNDENIKKYLKY